MRKRERSASASPSLRPIPVHVPVPAPAQADVLDCLERQRVLFDVLCRTSLAEQKDREIVEWLTDTAEWLQNTEFGEIGAGAQAELRVHVLSVLHTMPWWRVVESVDAQRAKAVAGGARHATRAITRWHEKIQLAFERVCAVLIEQSPHAVRGVLAAAMRPFQMRPPAADGAQRLIPGDSIMRLMNTVATRYPSTVVLDVLEQSMRWLVPKRRWAERRHHTACIGLLLHLALEAHVPLYPTRGDENVYLYNVNEAQQAEQKQPGGVQSPLESSARGSEESGTDVCMSSASNATHRMLRPVMMSAAVMSASDADFSDTSISMPTTQHSIPTRFADFAMQNNKMMAYRNELIRFVLQQLLEMELSLQGNENGPLHDIGSLDPLRSLMRMESVRSMDMPFVDILRTCTSLVFHRLAEDLLRQQAAGVCGNAEWWRELLAFHLSSVLKMESPVCLRFLAPSLALLGGEEEAVDMMHKLVSLVTKGYQPVQQSAWRAPVAGPARVRMAPPSVGPLMIPMAHRVRAAAYVYPLFHFMRSRLGNEEGTRKRILKWVIQELKKNASSPPSHLVQVLFAQCAAMSRLLDIDLVEEMLAQGPDAQAALRPLIEKYICRSAAGNTEKCSIGGQKLDLAKMEAEGLLHRKLMNDCPWDWRRLQGDRVPGQSTE